jgi:hypothetical protein
MTSLSVVDVDGSHCSEPPSEFPLTGTHSSFLRTFIAKVKEDPLGIYVPDSVSSDVPRQVEKVLSYFSETELMIMVHLIQRSVEKHNIDDSHGLHHHFRVLLNAINIMEDQLRLEERAPPSAWSPPELLTLRDFQRIVLASAFVHDTIDKKYKAQDYEVIVLGMLEPILGYRDHSPTHVQVRGMVSYIINNISFSKRREALSRDLVGSSTSQEERPGEFGDLLVNDFTFFPPPCSLGHLDLLRGKRFLLEACKIVADADVLDAYFPERVIAYQEHSIGVKLEPFIYPNSRKTIANHFVRERSGEPSKEEMDGLSMCRTIWERRVLTYKDMWMRTRKGLEIATRRHPFALEQKVLFERGNLVPY